MLMRIFGFLSGTNGTREPPAGWSNRHDSGDDTIVDIGSQEAPPPPLTMRETASRGRSGELGGVEQHAIRITARCVLYKYDVTLHSSSPPLRVQLSAILNERNLVDVTNDGGEQSKGDNAASNSERSRRSTARIIDGGNKAIVVEVALVFVDEQSSAEASVLTATLDGVAPHQSTELRYRRPAAAAIGGACGCLAVGQWCSQCVNRPNLITLYQAPLNEEDLASFGEELCCARGTATHLTRGASVGSHETLEFTYDSTLARDLYVCGAATDDGRGTLFVQSSDWLAAIDLVRNKLLANLPLADLSHAHLSLAMESKSVSDSVRIVIGVKCVEFETH